MFDHSKCLDGQRNEHCPTGLHTRVPILAMGFMLARKREQLRAKDDREPLADGDCRYFQPTGVASDWTTDPPARPTKADAT